MDDLLSEFLTETNESLDVVDVELVKFEQDPNNAKILDNIFRLVHTIKGTCGFLGLPRLEALAHAAETLMGKFRDGVPVTGDAVTLILSTIDRIKEILGELERTQAEPEGEDSDLIAELERMSEGGTVAADNASGTPDEEPLVVQTLERELRPGEVSLDELERAFRETEVDPAFLPKEAKEDASVIPGAPESALPVETVSRPLRRAVTDESEGAGRSESSLAAQSIRVNVDTLETLMTMVSELVLTRNQLLEIVRRHEDSEFKVPLQRLSNVTAELQEGVMKTRMQPIGNAWQKLPRIVRDLAQELGKNIELEMLGAETELDRQVLDFIKDPLTHMVRNSADHGLESPADRRAAGKPEKGTIRLSAYHEGGHIIIEIGDDGRGLNVDRIRKKAIENGLATEADLEKMSEQQIHKFIFHPGFSTATAVTSVSGRGVGMDVVKTNIETIGGTIDLRTVPGEGSTFIIKIPLTLAIISALIVEAAGERYAIPQLAVVELVRVQSNSEHKIEHIKDTPVLRLRNKLLPLIHLSKLLGLDDGGAMTDHTGFIVVTQVGALNFGIVVDSVFHTEEIVVKPMSSRLRHISMFSGTTILGDGSVIMIIDPNGIAAASGSEIDEDVQKHGDADAAEQSGSGTTMSLLLFRASGNEPKAVPLSLVTRLEEIDVQSVEYSNGRYLVQYRGRLMPLISISGDVKLKEEGVQPLLVFAEGDRAMGLLVDEIVDIVEEPLDIEIPSDTLGTVGSAVIKGQATEVIDVGYYLTRAFDDWFHRKEVAPCALRRRLLFVDDSAFFRNMLLPVLKAAGYEVTVAESASAGLSLVREGRSFDVVVSDIEMPEMSGFEFAEALRAMPDFRSVPIIALSSLSTPAAIERGRQAGFHDYVAKFDRPGLLAVLKETTTEMEAAA